VLEGDDHHRHFLRGGRRDLQRQRGFAHTGGASQQVQPLVEPAQEVIELRQPGGYPQHGAAGRFPLQAARFGVRQDLGQQRAGPLQPAGVSAPQRGLHAQGFLFQ